MLSKDGLLKNLFMSHLEETIDIVILPVLRHEYDAPDDLGELLESFIKDAALGDDKHVKSEFFKLIETRLISILGSSFRTSTFSNVPRINMKNIFLVLSRVDIDLPEKMDENPLIFYHLLMSPQAQAMSAEDLINGAFHEMILSTSKNLGIPIHGDPYVKFIECSDFPQILVNIIWDLGSTLKKKNAALKAFKVLSALYTANTWKISNHRDNSDSIPDILSTHFLLCMSHLLQLQFL